MAQQKDIVTRDYNLEVIYKLSAPLFPSLSDFQIIRHDQEDFNSAQKAAKPTYNSRKVLRTIFLCIRDTVLTKQRKRFGIYVCGSSVFW